MGFNFTNETDRKLFDSIISEQIEIYGLDIQYQVVNYDENKDKLYNEDTLPNITSVHDMKAYTTVIVNELFNFNKFGSFQSPDVVELFISQTKFKEIVGEDEEPHEGDLVFIKYTNRMWQVSSVHRENTLFLQKEFTWKLVLNAANNIGGTVNDDIIDDVALSDFLSGSIDFDDNEFIDNEVDNVVVTKSGDEPIFGSFE